MASPQTDMITAVVTEFRCVFTRNPRRKQKSWVDGRMDYHAFNKRVMVRDERGNRVGDAYWQIQRDLKDGDELELDQGGILVQVLDSVGSREQNISGLWHKKQKTPKMRVASAGPFVSARDNMAMAEETGGSWRQHGSNIQTPGPRSSATRPLVAHDAPRIVQYPSSRPPATIRHPHSTSVQDEEDHEDDDDRGHRYKKRRTREKNCHSQALFGATLAFSHVTSTPLYSPSYPRMTRPASNTTSNTRRTGISPSISTREMGEEAPTPVNLDNVPATAEEIAPPGEKGLFVAHEPRTPVFTGETRDASKRQTSGMQRGIHLSPASARKPHLRDDDIFVNVPADMSCAIESTSDNGREATRGPMTRSAVSLKQATANLPVQEEVQLDQTRIGLPRTRKRTLHDVSDSVSTPTEGKSSQRSLHVRSKRKKGLVIKQQQTSI